MKRVFLFIVTHIAILVVLSITLQRLFSTHPPLDERIAALKAYR